MDPLNQATELGLQQWETSAAFRRGGAGGALPGAFRGVVGDREQWPGPSASLPHTQTAPFQLSVGKRC